MISAPDSVTTTSSSIRTADTPSEIDPKVEKALREAMFHVAHAEADQIEPTLAVLDDAECT